MSTTTEPVVDEENRGKPKADRVLFKRNGSPHWQIRYSDRNGRIREQSTGTVSEKLARDILAKKKAEVAENRHLT
jgi:hypothetical protein